jgi:hypothetical protein
MLKQQITFRALPETLKAALAEEDLPPASDHAALDFDFLTKRLRTHAAAQHFGIFRLYGISVINFSSRKNQFPQ